MPRFFKNSIRSFISILLSLTLVSCQTHKKFETDLSTGNCDEALTNIPENDSTVRFLSSTKSGAGDVLSYSVAGAGYATQAALTVVGGVVIMVALCAPQMAVAAAGGGGVMTTPTCFSANDIFSAGLKAPSLGKGAREKTKHWGCPNVIPLAESVQKVSACYLKKAGPENLKKAEGSLKALKNSDAFFECLPAAEQAKVEESLNEIHKFML
jgi:hypothetical protein